MTHVNIPQSRKSSSRNPQSTTCLSVRPGTTRGFTSSSCRGSKLHYKHRGSRTPFISTDGEGRPLRPGVGLGIVEWNGAAPQPGPRRRLLADDKRWKTKFRSRSPGNPERFVETRNTDCITHWRDQAKRRAYTNEKETQGYEIM